MTTENTLSRPFGPPRSTLRWPRRGPGVDVPGLLLRLGRELADDGVRPPADDLPSAVTGAPPGGLTITDLYHAHRLELVRLAALLVDDVDAAQDIVQDAFTATYRRHGARLAGVDDPLRYLRRGVVNGSRSLLRRRRTARAWVPPHLPPAPSPEEDAVRAESDRELRAALDRLRPRQREVLVLRYFAGMSEADIARTLRVPQGTVKSTANRALKALHRMLEPSR